MYAKHRKKTIHQKIDSNFVLVAGYFGVHTSQRMKN